MKPLTLFIAFAIFVAGCAQTPQESGGAAEARAAAAAEYGGDEDRVCERVRRTGTHRSTVVCRTRAEIEQEARESKQTFDTLRNDQMNTTEYGRQ